MASAGNKKSTRIIFGVAGNIASGKGYLLKCFSLIAKEQAVPFKIIDVDTIRRFILKTSRNKKYFKLRQHLTKEIGLTLSTTNINHEISGCELGEIIFSNQEKFAVYKEIVNPLIKKILKKKLNHSQGIIAIEWAMLAEDGWLDLVNGNVVLTSCSDTVRTERLKATDLPLKQLQKRIEFQGNRDQKINLIRKWQQSHHSGWLYEVNSSSNPNIDFYRQLFQLLINQNNE